MRNNVPKLHELETFEPKQLIMELDIWHYFERPPCKPENLTKEELFNPEYYFITSGEAIEKTNFMLIDIDDKLKKIQEIMIKLIMGINNLSRVEAIKLLKSNKKLPKNVQIYKTYYDYVTECKHTAKELVLILRRFRGKNCFLETEWDSHRLLCISKNPRLKEEIDES
jgi:hypothetical protein